jgi:hypothetical protein
VGRFGIESNIQVNLKPSPINIRIEINSEKTLMGLHESLPHLIFYLLGLEKAKKRDDTVI